MMQRLKTKRDSKKMNNKRIVQVTRACAYEIDICIYD